MKCRFWSHNVRCELWGADDSRLQEERGGTRKREANHAHDDVLRLPVVDDCVVDLMLLLQKARRGMRAHARKQCMNYRRIIISQAIERSEVNNQIWSISGTIKYINIIM